MMPLEWFVLLFLIVLWRHPCLTQWNKEQSLLKYGLRFRVSMQPGTRPQVLSMMPLEWFVLLFLIVLWRPSLPHTMKTKSNPCSSMASASEWACKPGTRPQVLSMMSLEWFVLLFLIVLWRPSLPHTMKQRAILAQVWPPLPSERASQALVLGCCPMMPLEWFVLLFLIVLWRPSLPHTMKQRAIVAQVWPPLPSKHASQALVLRCCQWCLWNDSYYYSS